MSTVERTDLLVLGPATALASVLNIEAPARGAGDALPPLWHWVYLLDQHRQDELGPDGHALHGIPAPPGPGRLRMFAGGRVTTVTPLRLGYDATRVTRVVSTTEKQGRSGPLTFVTTRSEYVQDGEVAIIDEQDIVYRDPGSELHDRREPEPAASPQSSGDALELDVDPVLLFRFSALTYNAHRIHYDQDFTRAEGYLDLVVHGPLQALLMAERLRREGFSLLGRQFSYRLLAPTYGPQRLRVTHRSTDDGVDAAVHDGSGVQTAAARLSPADS
jgi:3-methylfumaryl-CoA hydratase